MIFIIVCSLVRQNGLGRSSRIARSLKRRAFKIAPGAKVVVIEDVITTGGSFREAVEPIEAAGGVVLCCACIVDRSGGKADCGAPLVALASLDVPAYPADALPPELAALPAEDPGSRRLNA